MALAFPILSGPLSGLRWRLDSPGKLFKVLSGRYEVAQTAAFARLLQPGDAFLDVGAHVGYYTLLAARLVGPEGRVASFEPNPGNLTYLRAHVLANRLTNVTIVDAAVSAREGVARFDHSGGSGTGHLTDDNGGIDVATVTLDAWCAHEELQPRVIKMDVEGAEVDALLGGRGLVETHRPALLLSTHGLDREEACRDFLTAYGYGFIPLYGQVGDPDREFLCTVDRA